MRDLVRHRTRNLGANVHALGTFLEMSHRMIRSRFIFAGSVSAGRCLIRLSMRDLPFAMERPLLWRFRLSIQQEFSGLTQA